MVGVECKKKLSKEECVTADCDCLDLLLLEENQVSQYLHTMLLGTGYGVSEN